MASFRHDMGTGRSEDKGAMNLDMDSPERCASLKAGIMNPTSDQIQNRDQLSRTFPAD